MNLGQNNNNNNYMDWMRQQAQNRYALHYEVIRVNGAAGANSFQMAPNSSQLLADTTNPNRIWLVMTDGAGYLTAQPYKVIPEEAEEPINVNSLEERIKKLEDMYGQLSGSIKPKKQRKSNNDSESATTTTD